MKNLFLFLLLFGSVALAAQSDLTFKPRGESFLKKQERAVPAAKQNPLVKQIGPSDATGSSQAVVVPEVPLAHTTQLWPLNKKGELVGKGAIDRQVNQVLQNIALALKEAGSDLNNLVKINIYLKQADLMPQVQAQLRRRFRNQAKPAVSFVVGDLVHPGVLVAMDAVATSGRPGDKKQVTYARSVALDSQSPVAHVAVLPVGGVVYVAGQAEKGALPEATRATLKQLEATLTHLELKKEHVVQLKAFLRPMTEVGVVEKEITGFFAGQAVPPVVYVEWLSTDPVVEIELISASPGTIAPTAAPLEFITPPFLTSSPIYSRVTRINRGQKVYVSGLYGKTAADAQTQVTEIFTELGAVLQKAGSNFHNLAKATYYVSNDQTSAKLNELRPQYYDPKRPPAASKAMVKGVGMAGMGITVDMIGVVEE